MGALLIDGWLHGLDAFPTIDGASVSLARETARAVAADVGLAKEIGEAAALVASELANNQLAHARLGQIAVRPLHRAGVYGVEVVAADRGPGIADPSRALAGAGPSERSLGAGLSIARRTADELDLDVRAGEGTCVRARFFGRETPRRREVAILGRPAVDEAVSGDGAAFVRTEDALLVAVVDGLGHGPLAQDASVAAVDAVLANAYESLTAILDACHAALASTRGAVVTLIRVDERTGRLEHVSVGNVVARVERRTGSQSFVGTSFVLGSPGPRRPPRVEHADLGPGDVLLVFTDGFVTRTSLADDPELLHEPAVTIAQRVMDRFARDNDDATVLVAK